MLSNHLLALFENHRASEFMVWYDKRYLYSDLLELIAAARKLILSHGIKSGNSVLLSADFSPRSVAMLLALLEANCIVGLISAKNATSEKYTMLIQAQFSIAINQVDNIVVSHVKNTLSEPLLIQLCRESAPGLVIFSSGSTGDPKAVVHDFNRLFNSFITPRKQTRVIAFLLFDHIGGMNTLFYSLFNVGCLITLSKRTPQCVLTQIERYRAEALTTTPTFLNLMLLSNIDGFDVASLQYINYSTEVMPADILSRICQQFPNARVSQAYGSSELGVLPVKSRSSNSPFISLNNKAIQYRIIDNQLQIKSNSSMLGYLNADSPFTQDGWYKTGDVVQQDGDAIRIIGRESEIINVGGEKVFPAEIENVLLKIKGIDDVIVFGEQNRLLGQIVTAKIKAANDIALPKLKQCIHQFCRNHLPSYKIPQKFIYTNAILHTERFKKTRNQKEVLR